MMRLPAWDLQLLLKALGRGHSPKRLPTINSNANLFQWVKKQGGMTLAHVEVGKNIKSAAAVQLKKIMLRKEKGNEI